MFRNKDERTQEVKIIIKSLTNLNLTQIYKPVKELFILLKKYIENEKSIKINIPFVEINKTIIGFLPIEKNKECFLKLENNKRSYLK